MKQRIKYLENEQARNEQATLDSPAGHVSPTQAGVLRRPPTSSINVETDTPGRVVDASANEVEYLSLTAMSGGNKNDQSDSQSSTLRQVLEGIVSINGTNPGVVANEPLPVLQSKSTLSQVQSEIMAAVDRDFVSLVRTFATTTSWYMPYISESMCLAALDAALQAETSTDSGSTATLTPDTAAMASSVLALGVAMSPFSNVLHVQALKLVDMSKRALPQVLTAAADTTAIQCLILQIILSLYYPSAGSTWHLLGLALSKAVSAGLHRSTPDGAANEEGKQVVMLFWMLYFLDRTIAGLMGRPFGIEDDDIALEIPALPTQQYLENSTAVSEAIFIWKVHHAHLLSQWRQSSNFDLDVSFASYEYWKDSYHEVCERRTQIEAIEEQIGETRTVSSTSIPKDEVRLSCRALIHLLDLSTRRLPADDPSLLELKQYIIVEIPRFIDALHTSTEDKSVALTFLDGYDAFAAAVMYVFCIYDPRRLASFRLGISQMKTVTASMDIIQSVAHQFKSLRGFKDVIWAFLQTLEARAEGGDAYGALRDVVGGGAPVPNHVKRLIDTCTKV